MLLHKTVLLNESIKALNILKNGIYIDGTFGHGGHSKKILDKLDKGFLYAFDKDPYACKYAKKINHTQFKIINDNFSKIKKYLEMKKIKGKVNGILLDLGISSIQLYDSKRGFSFLKNGPLDMRINQREKISISKWIQKNNEKKIQKILKKYGNEKFSKSIAKAIFFEKKNIQTTHDLAKIIKKNTPNTLQYQKSLKKTFLAFRIYINKETQALKKILKQVEFILKPKGRLVIITFNPIENKIIKNFIKKNNKKHNIPPEIPITDKEIKKIHNIKFKIFKKIKPSIHEKYYNTKSRNAVLRIIEKL
ncbi:16S rRNA (cytosine(1402)-N(4))-methyltransferase RsmH [Buchnera aphidicola (Mollitrichosiphum nigrofasciatum)]|uniref:16S rRNA (cytosine(1402)-N(4))-methyltransferase RsmH n=1 Tax=Buchnera aphidicola TaxID=9 RepID=UPI0031B8332A